MAQFARLGKREVRHHIKKMTGKLRTSPAAVETLRKGEKPVPLPAADTSPPREVGGPKGPEPTRYGDWEVNGRCSDF
jgi:hypothetical protein